MAGTTSYSPKIALALGSGSSRGWAHIGIIKALHRRGVVPDIVCGCSIGSLVAAAYMTGNLNKLEDWVCSLTRTQTSKFFEHNFSLNGFISKDHLYDFLTNYVCRKEAAIEDLPRIYATVATELETGREIWFTDGPLIEAVWASISIPGLFPPFKNQERWLVDGGLVNPVPVSICRALGADIVIAVNLNGDVIGKHFSEGPVRSSDNSFWGSLKESAIEHSTSLFPHLKFSHADYDPDAPGILDAIAGSINISQDRITRSRMAGDPPDLVLTPRLSTVGLLEFYRGEEIITEGVHVVERMGSEIDTLLKQE
ncbi:MAG: patatin-like phospholipase family protein [Thioalkalispiraceae bacterium]|jgi:NTE family protein